MSLSVEERVRYAKNRVPMATYTPTILVLGKSMARELSANAQAFSRQFPETTLPLNRQALLTSYDGMKILIDPEDDNACYTMMY